MPVGRLVLDRCSAIPLLECCVWLQGGAGEVEVEVNRDGVVVFKFADSDLSGSRGNSRSGSRSGSGKGSRASSAEPAGSLD